MTSAITPARTAAAPIAPFFLERWSRRAFAEKPVPEDTLQSLFEAARWAPSCYNEQPWLFVWGATEDELSRLRSLLVPGNLAWAEKAPVLAIVFARRTFARNGKPNRWAPFDAGAAWMSLALEAHVRGLTTHAMGGFDEKRAYELLGVPESDFEAMAAIAIGWPGESSSLPPALAERERPNGRKPSAEVARRLAEGGTR